MTTTLKGLEFDPGFAPYILAFRGTVEYLYMDINRFKNLSQKKMKFRQYYKKILDIFYNNLGFYTGCLMWAEYIKTQPKQEILSNHCFGQKYKEEDNISDTQFMHQFAELFSRDMKYFLGQDFQFEPSIKSLLQTYEQFLIINKGFTESKYNTDILLPDGVKSENPETYKEIIDNVLENGDLSKLLEHLPKIL